MKSGRTTDFSIFSTTATNMAIPKKDKDPSRADRKAKKRKAEDAVPDLPGDNNDPVEAETTLIEKPSKKRRHDGEDISAKTGELKNETPKKSKKEQKERTEKKVNAGAGIELNSIEAVEGAPAERKDGKTSSGYSAVDADEETTLGRVNITSEAETPKRSKKERKAERKAKEREEAASRPPATVEMGAMIPAGPTPPSAILVGGAAPEPAKSKKNNRNREKQRKNANSEPVAGANVAAKADKKADRFIVFIGISCMSRLISAYSC